MAYHNLEHSTFPIPSAPVRYHDIPAAQPVDSQTHFVPAAIPLTVMPPVAAAVQPAVYVPTPRTPEELDQVITRRVEFSGTKYFRDAKHFWKFNWAKLLLVTFMWGAVFMGAHCAINKLTGEHGSNRDWTDQVRFCNRSAVLKMGLLAALCVFVGMPALASAFTAVFNAMKLNAPVRFCDFFSCFCCRYYCRLIPLSIVLKGLTFLLSMLLVIPGIWFAIATVFALPLHRQHSFLGTCKSIRYSIVIVNQHFCSMLGFLLLICLLQLAGFLLFGVGLLFTVPYGFLALCYCYNDLIGINEMPMLIPQ